MDSSHNHQGQFTASARATLEIATKLPRMYVSRSGNFKFIKRLRFPFRAVGTVVVHTVSWTQQMKSCVQSSPSLRYPSLIRKWYQFTFRVDEESFPVAGWPNSGLNLQRSVLLPSTYTTRPQLLSKLACVHA